MNVLIKVLTALFFVASIGWIIYSIYLRRRSAKCVKERVDTLVEKLESKSRSKIGGKGGKSLASELSKALRKAMEALE